MAMPGDQVAREDQEQVDPGHAEDGPRGDLRVEVEDQYPQRGQGAKGIELGHSTHRQRPPSLELLGGSGGLFLPPSILTDRQSIGQFYPIDSGSFANPKSRPTWNETQPSGDL